jgi:transcriptional regulator with XRE-family HTH domain
MSATPGKAARMIRAARAAQHESQGQLAERMTAATGETWTRDHIAAIENGRKKVEADDIPAFAMVQGTQLGWYFDAQIGDVPDHSVPATLPTASPNPG